MHALGDRRGNALLEQRRCLDRGLHTGGAADVLFLGAGHEDDGAHVGPVLGRRDLVGDTVAAVVLLAHLPRHIATEQRATRRAGALARDLAELRRRGGQLVEICDCANERCETSGRRGEAGGGREVVQGDDLERVGGELGERRVFVLELLAEGAQLAEAGLRARARNVLRRVVECEAVGRVRGAARGGRVGAEVILRERDGERRVGREIESGVTLAPVSAVVV